MLMVILTRVLMLLQMLLLIIILILILIVIFILMPRNAQCSILPATGPGHNSQLQVGPQVPTNAALNSLRFPVSWRA